MAQTIGVVVETRDDGRATVVAEKGQGCGSCGSVAGCHGGRAGSAQKTQVLNRIGAAVGGSGDPYRGLRSPPVPHGGALPGPCVRHAGRRLLGCLRVRGRGWIEQWPQHRFWPGGICPRVGDFRCRLPNLVVRPSGVAGHHPNRQHPVDLRGFPFIGRLWL